MYMLIEGANYDRISSNYIVLIIAGNLNQRHFLAIDWAPDKKISFGTTFFPATEPIISLVDTKNPLAGVSIKYLQHGFWSRN